jgi:hypothetical protein
MMRMMLKMMLVQWMVVDPFLVPDISLTLTKDDPLEEADWVLSSAPIRGDSTFKLPTHITFCSGEL